MDEIADVRTSVISTEDRAYLLRFDRYQPYRLVSDVLERLRGEAGPLRILDVGVAESPAQALLPEDDVEALDLEEMDVSALPFEDGAFDFAVSVDALGRIDPEHRDGHLAELRRIARRGTLLAAPFDSGAVRAARRAAEEFYLVVHQGGYQRKHAADGPLTLDYTREFFETGGDEVRVLPSGFLPHWLAMTCLSYGIRSLKTKSDGASGGFGAFYNEFVYEHDNAEPSYRHLVVALKEPVKLDLTGLYSASSPAPEKTAAGFELLGALSATLPLAAEMRRLEARFEDDVAEYRRLLLEKEGALARREAQANDLSNRVAELLSLHRENASLRHQRNHLEDQLKAITGSRTWRMLAVPLAIRRRLLRLLNAR